MVEIKVIPEYLKIKLDEDYLKETPTNWRRPKGYNIRVGLTTTYFNIFTSSINNIAKYCGLGLRQMGSVLESDPVKLLTENKLLNMDHHLMVSEWGVSVLFKTKEDGLLFIEGLNKYLASVYRDLEPQLKIKLMLSAQDINEYENHNVIFTSRHLAEHFIESFKVPYFFRTLELVKVAKEGVMGIEAYISFYTKVSGQCHLCGKALTTEFSQAVGIGEVCCKKKLGIKRTKTADIQIVKDKIEKIANEIGVIGPILIPKNQISKVKLQSV